MRKQKKLRQVRLLLWAGTVPRLQACFTIISMRHIKVLYHFVMLETSLLSSILYLHHIWEPALFLTSPYFAVYLWFWARQGSRFVVLYKTMLCVHHNASSCSTQGENNRISSHPHYYNISLHIQGTQQWGPFHQANCLCVRGSKLFLYLSVMKPFFLITNRALVSQRVLHCNLQLNHRAKLSIFPRQFFRLPNPLSFFLPHYITVLKALMDQETGRHSWVFPQSHTLQCRVWQRQTTRVKALALLAMSKGQTLWPS